VYTLKTREIVYQINQCSMNLERCWIDDTGFAVAGLDAESKSIEVYSVQWQYNVKEIEAPKQAERDA
jgi:hypothetical protein